MGAKCAKRLIHSNNTRVIDISAQNAQINNFETNHNQMLDPRTITTRYAWQENNQVNESNTRNIHTIYARNTQVNRLRSISENRFRNVQENSSRNIQENIARNTQVNRLRSIPENNARNIQVNRLRSNPENRSRNIQENSSRNNRSRNRSKSNKAANTKSKAKSKYLIDNEKLLKQQRKLIKYYQKQHQLKNNYECCVCYTNNYNLRKKLRCKHSLCKICYRRLECPKRCPICRKSI